jgi:pimeloyl-ACP methyl ester carboxylesterase
VQEAQARPSREGEQEEALQEEGAQAPVRRWVAIAALGSALLAPSAAQAIDYAPVDQPGPALSVPQDKLDASLTCAGNPAGGSQEPVLLVPGTTLNPQHNFSWNWEPALTKLGIPWCAVELPGNSMGDIQVAGEYVVNAIRTMYARAGRKIAVVGHSQGGMVPRWALRFWPDTRTMVDDQIGLASSNHGTVDADVLCDAGCAPAIWQQRNNADFIKALNSPQETFPGISYTEVYSHNDEVVVPNFDDSGSSSLHGGGGDITNVAVQSICPLDVSEHLLIGTADSVAYALAIDAIGHPGPADPSRISSTVCTQPFMPGVNPLTFATDFAAADAGVATTLATYPHVSAEPPLACYVTASCAAGGSVESAAASAPMRKKCKKGKHLRRGKCQGKRNKK